MKILKYNRQDARLGPTVNFTGKVIVESPFTAEVENGYSGAMVNFDAGARTTWHTHPLGQMLIVTTGRGYVQKEGEEAQEITTGDVIWVPKDVKHWHGAAPNSAMSHIAIVQSKNGNATTWMEHVTDEEYPSE